MTRRGRKPTGPQLVERLEGSPHAKGRLKVILETLSGGKSVPEACAELGIQELMFHKMRGQALQTALDRLEPRPAGRKPQLVSAEVERIEELEAALGETRRNLAAAEIRRNLAETLPRLGRHREAPPAADEQGGTPAGKKTTHRSRAARRRKKRRPQK